VFAKSKPFVHFADAVLVLFGYPELSLTERHSLLGGMTELWFRAKDKRRFILYFTQFRRDAASEGIDLRQLGKYLRRRLKLKRLPRLDESIHPFIGAAGLQGVPRFTLR
jgi:hypothetical protein